MTIKQMQGKIFVLLNNGDYFYFDATKDQVDQVKQILLKDTYEESEILSVLDPTFGEKVQEIQKAQEFNSSIQKNEVPGFFFKDGKMYHEKLAMLSVPATLANKLVEVKDQPDELQKYVNFWMWVAGMKNAEVRESFFTYISKNNLIVTRQGWVLAVRKAFKITKANQEVIKEFERLRKNKKSTNVQFNYVDGTIVYSVDGKFNLKEEYYKSSTVSTYESSNIGLDGKPAVYTLLKESRLKNDEVDWNPRNECSMGYHLHMGKYRDYSYGDTRLLCAFNPMDVASCPYADGTKFRVAAFTPVKELDIEIKDYQIENEVETLIDDLVKAHKKRLKRVDLSEVSEFENGHTLLKDVPELKFNHIINTICDNVNTDIVKNRYSKV